MVLESCCDLRMCNWIHFDRMDLEAVVRLDSTFIDYCRRCCISMAVFFSLRTGDNAFPFRIPRIFRLWRGSTLLRYR